MIELNFGSLQDVLVSWPDVVIPEVGQDGVFDRVGMVLSSHKIAAAGPVGYDLRQFISMKRACRCVCNDLNRLGIFNMPSQKDSPVPDQRARF